MNKTTKAWGSDVEDDDNSLTESDEIQKGSVRHQETIDPRNLRELVTHSLKTKSSKVFVQTI